MIPTLICVLMAFVNLAMMCVYGPNLTSFLAMLFCLSMAGLCLWTAR